MKNGISRLMIVIAFGLALAGGAAAGMLAVRMSSHAAAQVRGGASPLAAQLQFTADQQQQIRKIWEHVQQVASQSTEEARSLDRARENKLLDLLTDEQKMQYKRIYQEYQDGFVALMARRERVMSDAIEQTRQLLSESQRQKYDAMLADRKGRNHGGDRDIMPPSKPSTTGPVAGGSMPPIPGV